ncbi:hypothetical protein IMZ16_05435 [Cruoricaptor ignavus]|uniref:Uncharacterized protein n=1 Tax=Cruoricaptor ignavus TaxID=1118202 RepID=A0A7M1T261_9FLAO|nr:hypothetical protein [Cruoricaptor ignavus]QOR72993.1 hypothetical protein IMZ16_05435 [Cruoricaptor ignavus]
MNTALKDNRLEFFTARDNAADALQKIETIISILTKVNEYNANNDSTGAFHHYETEYFYIEDALKEHTENLQDALNILKTHSNL